MPKSINVVEIETREITLLDGADHSRKGLSRFRECIKLFVRGYMNYPETKLWIQFWNSDPKLNRIAVSSPSIVKKIFRPYFSRRLTCSARLQAIVSHYRFVVAQGLEGLVLASIYSPIILVEFFGKNGKQYQLELVSSNVMEREGELTLQLRFEEMVIYSIAFLFLCEGDGYSIGIGCLQGGRTQNALDLIRQTTRDMYGLRPKTFLVKVVQTLGAQFNCINLRLVENKNRVVTQPLKKGKVKADYDQSWRELKATRSEFGDYVLPCVELNPPTYPDLPSSKRSEARKRHMFLCSVAHEIRRKTLTYVLGTELTSDHSIIDAVDKSRKLYVKSKLE